MKFQDLININQ